jgi:hypothetical protein
LGLNPPGFNLIGENQQAIVRSQKVLLFGFLAQFLAGELHLASKQLEFGA